MTGWQTTWEVARWEFRRFVKPKQLLVSVLLTLVGGAAGYGAMRIVRSARAEPVTVAVIGGETLGLGATTVGDRVSLVPQEAAAEAALRDSVAARALDGLLVVHEAGGPIVAELVARRDPPWRMELEAALTAAARERRLAARGLAAADLATLLAPVSLTVRQPAGDPATAGRGERVLTILVLALSFVGVMSGMGFIFAGITGEKQQRVTEQLVAIVPPQRWVDGKILGLAGVAMVNTLVTALGFVVLFGIVAVVRGTSLSLHLDRPLLVPLLVLLPLLGFLLWFTFLCAVAATIDDPNTSAKGSLLLLPMLPLAIAGVLFTRADSTVAQAFGVFPLTAPAVLPVRLLLADVAPWEVPLALVLLLLTIWLLRRAAGKIFATGILMYGKEPSLREIWRWAREA